MQARRDGWRRVICQRRNRGNGAPRFAFALRLQDRLGHLLNEQRNAIGALDNVLPNPRRQLLIAGDAVDDGSGFPLAEPVERQRGHARLADPRRVEFRPKRHDQQHARGS